MARRPLHVDTATGEQHAMRGGPVPLGRWEGSAVASLTADNVFDDAIYSHYTIVGQFMPATNNVNLIATLRTSTPSDVGGGLRCGGYVVPLNTTGGGTVANQSQIVVNVSNDSAGGVKGFWMRLQFRSDGVYHPFSGEFVFRNGANTNHYARHICGEFIDVTPRQGIKFSFSSGNIAAGWFEIVGHLKQG